MKIVFIFIILLLTRPVFSIPVGELESKTPELMEFFDSGEIGTFKTEDNVELGYGAFVNPDAKGSIVLLEGRSESKEKYAEVIFDFYHKGYSIFIFDFRGQGLSQRMLEDSQKGHINDYQEYIVDLKTFLSSIVVPKSQENKIFGLSHSMGGNVISLALAAGESRFSKVVLSSPMLDLPTKPLPPKLAWGLFRFLEIIGMSESFVPGRGHYDFKEVNRVTGSPERFNFAHELRRKNEKFLVGGPTVKWVRVSLEATWDMRDQAPNIKTPLLLLQAGEDHVVYTEGQDYVCVHAQNCKKVFFPKGHHELLFETDDIRDKAFAEIIKFIESED